MPIIMHAKVLSLVLLACRVSDAPALGCAILAAVAAGLHPTIHAGVDAMVHTARVIQPDPQAHQEYQRFYRAYKSLVRGHMGGGGAGRHGLLQLPAQV
jgi:ribulose kinase